MSAGDQLTPCSICLLPGHWESACPKPRQDLEAELARLRETLRDIYDLIPPNLTGRLSAKRAAWLVARWRDVGRLAREALGEKFPDGPGPTERRGRIWAFERAKAVLGCDCAEGRRNLARPNHHAICVKSMLDREIAAQLPEGE